MLIVNLKDQLGNQMFAYASVKSIAMKKGVEFGFNRIAIDDRYINDTDDVLGSELFTIFNLPESEKIDSVPDTYSIYHEEPMRLRHSSNYVTSVINKIEDNVVMDGHFITTSFFRDYIEEVRKWFKIPKQVENDIHNKIISLSNNGERKTVSVHFRVGNDYTKLGYRLKESYWHKAAEFMISKFSNPIFICLYDKKTPAVERFIKKFNAIDARGSLVEDMCLISKCDGNIVCNSTFSIMSALLNNNSKHIVCPMKYPTQVGYMPEDCFWDSWTRIGDGRRDFISGVYYRLHKILYFLKKIISVKNY